MIKDERIWVRLERDETKSWNEVHVMVPPMYPRQWLFAFLDGYCASAFPGWEVVTYCVPEAQDADGRPDDEKGWEDGSGN